MSSDYGSREKKNPEVSIKKKNKIKKNKIKFEINKKIRKNQNNFEINRKSTKIKKISKSIKFLFIFEIFYFSGFFIHFEIF